MSLVHGIGSRDLRQTFCGINVAESQMDGHVHILSWADLDCPECRLSKGALFFVFDMREGYAQRRSAELYESKVAGQKMRLASPPAKTENEQISMW